MSLCESYYGELMELIVITFIVSIFILVSFIFLSSRKVSGLLWLFHY